MMPGIPAALLLLLQDSDHSIWDTIISIVIAVVFIGLRMGLGRSGFSRYGSSYEDDSGLNSGCWFNMLPGARRRNENYFVDDTLQGDSSAFAEDLRQVYPRPDLVARIGGMGGPEAPPARLPVRTITRGADETDNAEAQLRSNTKAGAVLRRTRYQQIQQYHEEVDERWQELIRMLEMLGDPNMSEGWQSLSDGPFGLTTAVEQIRETLSQARAAGVSTARLVQCEAPLDIVQQVVSHVRQSADPTLPEATRQRLRDGVLEYVRRDVPALKRNIFGLQEP